MDKKDHVEMRKTSVSPGNTGATKSGARAGNRRDLLDLGVGRALVLLRRGHGGWKGGERGSRLGSAAGVGGMKEKQ